MISASLIFASLVAYALILTSIHVKKNFLPNISIVFFSILTYLEMISFVTNFINTLFPSKSHSLKLHDFSLPLCHLMGIFIYMLRYSLYHTHVHFILDTSIMCLLATNSMSIECKRLYWSTNTIFCSNYSTNYVTWTWRYNKITKRY